MIHVKEIDHFVENSMLLPEVERKELDDITIAIGKNVAELVKDGSCLQMGIGAIPDATLSFLSDRKHLGIHTEMFAEGLIDLMESGAVTNEMKRIRPGITVSSFCLGTQRLYDYIDDNQGIHFLTSDYVNNPDVIAQNDNVVAINSCIEIDLSGQVASDSIGNRIFR